MQLKFYFIYLTIFVNVMAFTLVFPLLPLYAKAFNATSFQIGLLAASFGLAQLFFSPLWGMISDRIGRKPTILIGVAGLALGFLMFGFANSLQSLFIARFLQGIFSGAALPSARAYVADLTNKNERVKAMGRVGAAMALGVIVGPFIGTVLAETSLSFPFFVSAGVAAINFILVALFLPESLTQKSKKLVLKEGFLNLGKMRKLFKGPLAPILILAFLWSFGLANNQIAIPLLSIENLSASIRDLGTLFGVRGVIALITQLVLLSYIARVFGERRAAVSGLALMAVAVALMPFLPSFNMLLIMSIFSAFGSSVARPLITALASEETSEGQGVTMGVMTSVESLGRIIGPLSGGMLFGISSYMPFLFSSSIILSALIFISIKFNFFTKKHHHPIA